MKKILLLMTICMALLVSACTNNSAEMNAGSSETTESTVNETKA